MLIVVYISIQIDLNLLFLLSQNELELKHILFTLLSFVVVYGESTFFSHSVFVSLLQAWNLVSDEPEKLWVFKTCDWKMHLKLYLFTYYL